MVNKLVKKLDKRLAKMDSNKNCKRKQRIESVMSAILPPADAPAWAVNREESSSDSSNSGSETNSDED